MRSRAFAGLAWYVGQPAEPSEAYRYDALKRDTHNGF